MPYFEAESTDFVWDDTTPSSFPPDYYTDPWHPCNPTFVHSVAPPYLYTTFENGSYANQPAGSRPGGSGAPDFGGLYPLIINGGGYVNLTQTGPPITGTWPFSIGGLSTPVTTAIRIVNHTVDYGRTGDGF